MSGHANKAEKHGRKACQHCGARRVDHQIGNEPTPAEYVASLVEVFTEVWRVLRDDGVLWLNLGDTYNGYMANQTAASISQHNQEARPVYESGTGKNFDGLSSKSLLGIPWRVAFALQDYGWHLRSAPPWIKRNPMPESTEDRPGSAHEYCFLLTKNERYYYDFLGVRTIDAGKPSGNGFKRPERLSLGGRGSDASWKPGLGCNRRTSNWFFEALQDILDGGQGLLHDECGNPAAFVVNIRPFKGAHFAVWPEALVRPMLKSGTSERGCCVQCQAPWMRVVAKSRVATRPAVQSKTYAVKPVQSHAGDICGNRDPQRHATEMLSLGWYPSCGCDNLPMLPTYPPKPKDGADAEASWTAACDMVTEQRRVLCLHAESVVTQPCVVLDPFAGSGSTLKVAVEMGRHAIGVELNHGYRDMALRRVQAVIDEQPLFFQEPV